MGGKLTEAFPLTDAADVPEYIAKPAATDDSVLLDLESTFKALRDAITSDPSVWNHVVRLWEQNELTRATYAAYVMTIAERSMDPKVWEVCKTWFAALTEDPDAYSAAFAESLLHRVVSDLIIGPLTMIVDGLGWCISVSAASQYATFKSLLPDVSGLPAEETRLLRQLVADGDENITKLVESLNSAWAMADKAWDAAAQFLDRPVLTVLENALMIAQTVVEVITEAVQSDELLALVASVAADPAKLGALHGNIVGFVLGFVVPGADEVFVMAASGKLFRAASEAAAAAGVFEQVAGAATNIVQRPRMLAPAAAPRIGAASGVATISAAPTLGGAAAARRTFKIAKAAEVFEDFEKAYVIMFNICRRADDRLRRRLSASMMAKAAEAAEGAKLSVDAVKSAGTVASKMIASIHGLEGSYESVRRVTSRVNGRVWFLSALNPEVLAHGATNWNDITRALQSTRLFEAAHLPIDGRFLDLPTTFAARRELEDVLRYVHPGLPSVATAADMNAVAVLGAQHRTSVNSLIGSPLRSRTDTLLLHPTLTNRMNAAILVDQNIRTGQKIGEGVLVVTESTPLREILSASEKVLQDPEFATTFAQVKPLLDRYKAAAR